MEEKRKLEETQKKRTSEELSPKTKEVTKKSGNNSTFIILSIMLGVFVICGVLGGFAIFSIREGNMRKRAQTTEVIKLFTDESIKVTEYSESITALEITKDNAPKTQEDVNQKATSLLESITKSETAAKELSLSLVNTTKGYEALTETVKNGQSYVTMKACLVGKTEPYANAITLVQENMRTYGVAQGNGNYSPEVARQQKVKEGLNTAKKLHEEFRECITDESYLEVMKKDDAAIDRYVTEFVDPFIAVLRTGNQLKIQPFMNNIGTKSWLSLGWRNYIKADGTIPKELEQQKAELAKAPETISQITEEYKLEAGE
jgi:hypothetical protein